MFNTHPTKTMETNSILIASSVVIVLHCNCSRIHDKKIVASGNTLFVHFPSFCWGPHTLVLNLTIHLIYIEQHAIHHTHTSPLDLRHLSG